MRPVRIAGRNRALLALCGAASAWALFWLWFGAVSGAEAGWLGLWRNLPNALPWLLALLVALAAWRWPRAGGWALTLIGLLLLGWVLPEFWASQPLPLMIGLLALPPLLCGLGLLLVTWKAAVSREGSGE